MQAVENGLATTLFEAVSISPHTQMSVFDVALPLVGFPPVSLSKPSRAGTKSLAKHWL